MSFRYYPRYASLVILIIFGLILAIFVGQDFSTYLFLSIFALIGLSLFVRKYEIENDVLIEYLFSIKVKEINISSIKKVEIVEVKKLGSINLYIGKDANANKEDGYYLLLENGEKIKIYNGYRNKDRISIGKYIIAKYHKKSKSVEIYKFTNGYF